LSHTERDVEASKNLVENEALHIWEEEKEANRAIIRSGQTLIQSGDRILTHCNTGPLATGGLGTALGIILEASREGKHIQAWVDETRPFLQGARLTSWELAQGKVPFRLITDSMAGYFMRRREVDIVLVGADRIAANGDVANKIGTYSLAVLAQEHEIPFYVAAPVSSFDLTRVSGDDIPIEERDPQEVTHLMGHRIAPDGIEAANPVFDITPSRYIRAFITEKGILRPPWSSLLVLPAGLGKSAGSESK
jgi:methylthioribose-1-phosphate isomerase